MKKTVYFILLSAATFLISCASNTTGIDAYTETLYKPSYASGFEIVGAEGRQSTLLKVFNPWQGAENTETTLFIVRNGEKIPAGFTGQVVKAGARRIVCLSSTYVAMLDALGQVDRVVGVSGRNYISNKYVTTHPEAVADIGFDGNIDYELLLAPNGWWLSPRSPTAAKKAKQSSSRFPNVTMRSGQKSRRRLRNIRK